MLKAAEEVDWTQLTPGGGVADEVGVFVGVKVDVAVGVSVAVQGVLLAFTHWVEVEVAVDVLIGTGVGVLGWVGLLVLVQLKVTRPMTVNHAPETIHLFRIFLNSPSLV